MDAAQVAVQDEGPVGERGGVREEVLRVGALEHGAGEDPVGERVDPAHRVGVALAAGERADVVDVEGDRALGVGAQAVAQGLDGEAVAQVEVVGGAQGGDRVGAAGGVDAGAVAEEGAAPGFVEGGPGLHPVAQGVGGEGRVLGEPLGGGALGPAARVLQFLRQVPVVEGGDGLDALLQQAVDEAPVEVEALLYGGTAAGGPDAGPGEGEPVGAQAQFGHEGDVLAPAVVVVGGDVTGVAARTRPGVRA